MTSKLERIVSHCKSSVTVTANDHTVSYQSVAECLSDSYGKSIIENASLSDSQADIVERCIKAGIVWEVQAYDQTPIGSYTTIGATMDEALDVMLEVLGLEDKS